MSLGVLQRRRDDFTARWSTPFDIGIYIRFSRRENYLWLGEDARVFQRTILTAVVAAELYAGTHNHREKPALDELCQAHRALGHFSSPPAAAWIDTGVLLRRARSVFGHMDFVRHFRDLLIAVGPARAGATLVTRPAQRRAWERRAPDLWLV
jgi:predicted nucleic acid-binding protein